MQCVVLVNYRAIGSLHGVKMLSDPVSGSLDIESLISEMLNLQTGSSKSESEPTPYQVVSGSGDAWYFSPAEKKMIRVNRGSEILVISVADENGKVYASDSGSRLFIIPVDEVIDIGYN